MKMKNRREKNHNQILETEASRKNEKMKVKLQIDSQIEKLYLSE